MTPSVITISRQYGRVGRHLGRRLAEQLNIPFYDKEIIDRAANISGLSPDFIERQEGQFSGSLLFDLASVLDRVVSAAFSELGKEVVRCVLSQETM